MLKRILFGILLVCTTVSCTKNQKPIVNNEEVIPFLSKDLLNEKKWDQTSRR